MNNNLRYLALALLLTTNVVVAEDAKTVTPTETDAPTTAPAKETSTPTETDAPTTAPAKEDVTTTSKVDWTAFYEKVDSFKEWIAEDMPEAVTDATDKASDAIEAVEDAGKNAYFATTQELESFYSATAAWKHNGVASSVESSIKKCEKNIKATEEKIKAAKKGKDKKEVEALEEKLKDYKSSLKSSKDSLATAKKFKAEHLAVVAKIDAAKANVYAEATEKAVTDAEKALEEQQDNLDKLEALKKPSKAIKSEIADAKKAIEKKTTKLEKLKEKNEAAQKAKTKTAKEAKIEEGSSFLSGVSAFVTAHPVAVAVGGTTATLVAVYALYKWNKVAHQAATLEEELAELEMTSVNA
jgi:hypothetical protein